MRASILSLFLLVWGLTAQLNGAESLKENNPDAVPGSQILMKADLHAAIGKPNRGEDRLDESKTQTIDFWFFFPSDDSAKTDDGYPLLLFLHGSSKRGDDPELVKAQGPAAKCADPEIAKTWRFITVSPQCKANVYWSPKQLVELIERVCESYPVDRSRIYVTGLSLGGFGAWSVAAEYGSKLAAVAPVCGWYIPAKAAEITAPVWAFHGDADPSVKVGRARSMIDAVKKAGNADVTFTVYPGVEHTDTWIKTYDNPLLYDWLLSKQLPPTISGPKPESGKQVLMTANLPSNVGNPFWGEDKLDPENKEEVRFWAFQPSDESAKTDAGYPLLLFLHGGGECGSDPNVLKQYGPTKFCDDPEIAKTWKFFTVSPQCKQGSSWSPSQLMALLDEVCAKFPIDRSRVYVTGLSLGGVGTWGVAALGKDKIAAAAPLCGHLNPPEKGASVQVPLWVFHGGADPVVSLDKDQATIDAAKAAGNDDIKFTIYPGVGHDCWTKTYANPELYDWFLSKTL